MENPNDNHKIRYFMPNLRNAGLLEEGCLTFPNETSHGIFMVNTTKFEFFINDGVCYRNDGRQFILFLDNDPAYEKVRIVYAVNEAPDPFAFDPYN